METVKTTDNMLIQLLFAYCAGKGFLFNWFFGWRGVKNNINTFKLPKKDFKNLMEIYYLWG